MRKSKPDTTSLGEPDTPSVYSECSATDSPSFSTTTEFFPASFSKRPDDGVDERSLSDVSSVEDLQMRLRDNEALVTELRLDALSSFQQMEQLQETVTRLETEVFSLKAENQALQQLLSTHQGTSSSDINQVTRVQTDDTVIKQPDLSDQERISPSAECLDVNANLWKSSGSSNFQRQFTLHHQNTESLHHQNTESNADDVIYTGIHRVLVSICHEPDVKDRNKTDVTLTPDNIDEENVLEEMNPSRVISSILITEHTSWNKLDLTLKNLFLEYIRRWDAPNSKLNLNCESLQSYRLGDVARRLDNSSPGAADPDLIPVYYCSPDTEFIRIYLKGSSEGTVDALSYNTLVPCNLLEHYISQLHQSRFLVLDGPRQSGKSYIALQLARYLDLTQKGSPSTGSVVKFTVTHQTRHDLASFLSNIIRRQRHSDAVSRCQNDSVSGCHDDCVSQNHDDSVSQFQRIDCSVVVIIEDLENVESFTDAFRELFDLSMSVRPYLICIFSSPNPQSSSIITSLHSDVKFVRFTVEEEPLRSFLPRFLRRQLVDWQFRYEGNEDNSETCDRLSSIIEWLTAVWEHVNTFIKTFSKDHSIGPGMFLSCPMDVAKSRLWFTETWNELVVPGLLRILTDMSTVSCNDGSNLDDPSSWVIESFPWSRCEDKSNEHHGLLRLSLNSRNVEEHIDTETVKVTARRSSISTEPCSDVVTLAFLEVPSYNGFIKDGHVTDLGCNGFRDVTTLGLNHVSLHSFI